MVLNIPPTSKQRYISDTFKSNGCLFENLPIFVADRPRACFGLYCCVRKCSINSIILDYWFPSTEDKQVVYKLLKVA